MARPRGNCRLRLGKPPVARFQPHRTRAVELEHNLGGVAARSYAELRFQAVPGSRIRKVYSRIDLTVGNTVKCGKIRFPARWLAGKKVCTAGQHIIALDLGRRTAPNIRSRYELLPAAITTWLFEKYPVSCGLLSRNLMDGLSVDVFSIKTGALEDYFRPRSHTKPRQNQRNKGSPQPNLRKRVEQRPPVSH